MRKHVLLLWLKKTTFRVSNIHMLLRFSCSVIKGSPQLLSVAYNAKNTSNNLG